MKIKTGLILFLSYLFSANALFAQQVAPFREGERAVFLGNSITDGGHYHSYIWLYYMTRFPNSPIRVLNAGVGGDRIQEMYKRLDGDVFSKQPTVLMVTFGMNDSGYFEYNGDNAVQYGKDRLSECYTNYQLLEKRLQNLPNVRIVMVGGSPYDQTAQFENTIFQKKNDVMLQITGFQEASAQKNHWEFVDFNRPMTEINLREQKTDPAFTLCGGDRIHPDNDGHMVMAYLFLKAQGFVGREVSDMQIDAAKKKVIQSKYCRLSGLKVSPSAISFDYLAESLPYPLDHVARGWGQKKSQSEATKIIPFMEEMNKEQLKISGLKGRYRLSIDDAVIGEWTDEQLAAGINLAAETNTPQYKQALSAMYLNEERWEIEHRFRDYAWVQFNFFQPRGLLFANNDEALRVMKENIPENGWLAAKSDLYERASQTNVRESWEQQMDLLIDKIYAVSQPVVRKIELKKIEPAAITELKCENLVNPNAIDNTQPHFSWKIKSDQPVRQQSYEIQIASDSMRLANGSADLWDSGKIDTSSSVMVPYKGSGLTSRSLCYWRVRIWNEKGDVSAWSPIARFGIGILDKKDMQGSFIGLASVKTPILRKKFTVTGKNTSFLHVNSLGYHEVYLNGKKVSEDVLSPAVSQLNKRSPVITYDVTDYLQTGENELVIWLGQGWYKQSAWDRVEIKILDSPVVRAQLDVRKNGKWNTLLVTGAGWLGRASGYEDTGSWNALRFGGEKINAANNPKDLYPATLNKLQWLPAAIMNVPEHEISPEMTEPNRIQEKIQAKEIKKIDNTTWFVDMGKSLNGWFELRLPQLAKGQTITISYSDDLGAEGKWVEMEGGQSDQYIASGEAGEVFKNKFNHHAFRYVKIENLPVEPAGQDVNAYLIHTDYRPASSFECSDPDLNAIHDMVQYTMRCLAFSGYMVDCPHLERAGYGGDGNSSTLSLQTMYDAAPLFTNWLQAWGDAMREGGSLPHVAPNPGAGGGGPYWCGFIIMAPWQTYVNYNDSRLIEKYYPFMKEWLGYVDKYTVNNLLKRWPDLPYRDWYLGDWLAPSGVDSGAQSSVDLVNNCFISDCLDKMEKIATVLGKADEAAEYAKRRNSLNQLLHATYYNSQSKTYSTGSQLDMSYPMLVGAVPSNVYSDVKEQLFTNTDIKHRGHIAAGLVGVPVVTKWAIENKAVDFIYTMLKKRDYPGYLYMIDNGATTTWESWNRDRSRIHNCYNGIGSWFYQAIGGIRPDEANPGYRNVIIEPQIPKGVAWANVTKETPYGTLIVNWKRQDDQIKFEITIPVGCTAKFIFADIKSQILENGRHEIVSLYDTFSRNH